MLFVILVGVAFAVLSALNMKRLNRQREAQIKGLIVGLTTYEIGNEHVYAWRDGSWIYQYTDEEM